MEQLSKKDLQWQKLNQQFEDNVKGGDLAGCRNIRLLMAKQLMQENRPSWALRMLCEVAAFDLSDLINGNPKLRLKPMRDHLEDMIEQTAPYKDSVYTMAPFVTGWIAETQDVLGLSVAEFGQSFWSTSTPSRFQVLQESSPTRSVPTS